MNKAIKQNEVALLNKENKNKDKITPYLGQINNQQILGINKYLKNEINLQDRNKIVMLQDELLSFRKEISVKQYSWNKQRNYCLTQKEILKTQLSQLKQKIINLTQINQNLSIAMTTSNHQQEQNQEIKVKELNLSLAMKQKQIGQLKNKINQLEKQIQKIKENIPEKIKKAIEDYRGKNERITLQNIEEEYDRKIERIKILISKLPINENIKQKIINVGQNSSSNLSSIELKRYNISHQSSYLCLQNTGDRDIVNYRNNDKNSKNTNNVRDLPNHNKSLKMKQYTKSRPNLRINKSKLKDEYLPQRKSIILTRQKQDYYLNNNQKHYENILQESNNNMNDVFFNNDENQDGYSLDDRDDVNNILCQICNKVYQEEQFINHMKDCRQYNMLMKKKNIIQSRLMCMDWQQHKNDSIKLQHLRQQKYKSVSKSKGKHQLSYGKQSMENEIRNIIGLLNKNNHNGYRQNNTNNKHNNNTSLKNSNRDKYF